MLIHMFIGRIAVVVLPMFWAYNVAQRGDSFGYAVFTYFGNFILLGLIWSAVWWLLEKLSIGVLMSKD